MPQPRVQSLERALDLLEALAGTDELGVSDLAAQTGLVPSTAHRLLGTLVSRGYAAQSPASGRYLLGYKLLELTSGAAGPARAAAQRRPAAPGGDHGARPARRRTWSCSRARNAVYIESVTGHAQRAAVHRDRADDPRPHLRLGQGAAGLARRRRRRRRCSAASRWPASTPRTLTTLDGPAWRTWRRSAAAATRPTTRSTSWASRASRRRSSTPRACRWRRSASPARRRG